MPQLAVNMKVNIQNKDCRNLKNCRFKKRHAPYSNRSHHIQTVGGNAK